MNQVLTNRGLHKWSTPPKPLHKRSKQTAKAAEAGITP